MANEKEKIANEDTAPEGSVSDQHLEDVSGGQNRSQKLGTGQVSPGDPAADFNGDGNVTLHEVVTHNRDQRNKN